MAMFGNRKGGNPFAPNALRAYQPTVRDRAANALRDVIGDGYQRNLFVENLLGSSGLGHSKTGAVDYTPLGAMFQGDEGGRKVASGNVFGGAADIGLAAIPLPAAAKGAKGVFGAAKGSAERSAKGALEARLQRAASQGYTLHGYHGTDAVFDRFDPAKIGTATDAGHLGAGFYFSTDPRVIGKRSVGMPVLLKLEKPYRASMPDMRTDKRTLIPADLGDHDGVILDYSPAGYHHQEIMVRSPDQIRSYFDPFE